VTQALAGGASLCFFIFQKYFQIRTVADCMKTGLKPIDETG
jgi:hypothetical protein